MFFFLLQSFCCCCSVPLPEFSTFVLRHVVDLIYNGQIMVAAEVKPRIEAALYQLKIKGVIATNPADQQTSTTTTTTTTATTMPTMPAKPATPMVAKRKLLMNFSVAFGKCRLKIWSNAMCFPGPISNLIAAKSVSASVPNLLQVPNGQAYKRELSANSIQYGNSMQPPKRPRPQSV